MFRSWWLRSLSRFPILLKRNSLPVLLLAWVRSFYRQSIYEVYLDRFFFHHGECVAWFIALMYMDASQCVHSSGSRWGDRPKENFLRPAIETWASCYVINFAFKHQLFVIFAHDINFHQFPSFLKRPQYFELISALRNHFSNTDIIVCFGHNLGAGSICS